MSKKRKYSIHSESSSKAPRRMTDHEEVPPPSCSIDEDLLPYSASFDLDLDEPPASSMIFGNEQDNEDQKSEDSDSENEDSGDEERDKLALPTNEDDIEVSDIVVSM